MEMEDSLKSNERMFWSNCVIEALKQKFKKWKCIQLIPIIHGFHFHMMWYDGELNKVRHFTNKNRCSDFFFKGRIEEVSEPRLLKWAKRKGVEI